MPKKNSEDFDDGYDDDDEGDDLEDHELDVDLYLKYNREGNQLSIRTSIVVDVRDLKKAEATLRGVRRMMQCSAEADSLGDHDLTVGKDGELAILPVSKERRQRRKRRKKGRTDDGNEQTSTPAS